MSEKDGGLDMEVVREQREKIAEGFERLDRLRERSDDIMDEMNALREDLEMIVDEAESDSSRNRKYGPFRGVRSEGIVGQTEQHWLGTCPNCRHGILFGESYYHGEEPIDCPFCEYNEAHDYHDARTREVA